MVNIASPTGEEGLLAAHLAAKLKPYCSVTQTQEIDRTQSNAFGQFTEFKEGKTLMLYAPIDTVTSNDEAEDLPWLGPVLSLIHI